MQEFARAGSSTSETYFEPSASENLENRKIDLSKARGKSSLKPKSPGLGLTSGIEIFVCVNGNFRIG